MKPCTNCGSTEWAAKNDNYCTDCERQWWDAYTQTISRHPNPKQQFADEVIGLVNINRKFRDASFTVVGLERRKNVGTDNLALYWEPRV